MTSQNLWTREWVLEYFKQRRLVSSCPPLIEHLYPGAKVLDVGCGSGGLSLDIATRVRPGMVYGVDLEAKSIEQARALAHERGSNNISFEVGDARQLHFAEASFDLTVGLHILNYLHHPAQVIAEWRRVTRPGGRVVAQTSDVEARIYYPPCPARQRWDAAFQRQRWGEDCLHLGRRGVEAFAAAGLQDITVDVYGGPEFVHYPSKIEDADFRRRYVGGPIYEDARAVVEAGLIDQATIDAANREGEAWLAHPHAFYAAIGFLISGTVP